MNSVFFFSLHRSRLSSTLAFQPHWLRSCRQLRWLSRSGVVVLSQHKGQTDGGCWDWMQVLEIRATLTIRVEGRTCVWFLCVCWGFFFVPSGHLTTNESERGRATESVNDLVFPPSCVQPQRSWAEIIGRKKKLTNCNAGFPRALPPPPLLTCFSLMCSRLDKIQGMKVSRAVKVHLGIKVPCLLYRTH